MHPIQKGKPIGALLGLILMNFPVGVVVSMASFLRKPMPLASSCCVSSSQSLVLPAKRLMLSTTMASPCRAKDSISPQLGTVRILVVCLAKIRFLDAQFPYQPCTV